MSRALTLKMFQIVIRSLLDCWLLLMFRTLCCCFVNYKNGFILFIGIMHSINYSITTEVIFVSFFHFR
jgi:hypothetical protein